ncbi:hypothetical protein [Paraburkholderia sp. DHOC27]|uniref:hypothetical protein n=1 Tax=Paraburkholderia sp. DHOC27 TaxID=2303330 RepID=UPI0015F32508|nr:hypothetical protein [Paraburkholderia sp. DHOC27]
MKFFIGAFILLVTLLAFGIGTEAYSHVRSVKTETSNVHVQRAPANNIDPGDFVHAD